jgi:hypothetical protein
MTDDPNGWPDASKPGVPLHPERDGTHWVSNTPRGWLANLQMWHDIYGYCVPPAAWGVLPYGGPCLTPAEVAARVAELEARNAWLEQIREGAGRALCEVDGIDPDDVIADGGHVAWEMHVYQRAHAALARSKNDDR